MSHRKYSLLYPAEQAEYKTLSQTTMHDLGLDQICKKLSAKEAEQNYILNVMARMYADPVVTQYRCDIFEDVLQNKKMRDDMMEILGRISFLKDYGGFKREYDDSASIWDLLHRLDEINDYIKCVDALHTCLADPQLHSAGFLGLREYVEEIYADNGFAELKQDIAGLKLDTSQLKSITVGINLNDRFEADGIGLVSINSKYFTKAGILGNFYEHIAAKDRINADTAWKKDFKFQPFDVNAEGALHTPLQKAMGAGATAADAMVGIVSIPEGDQAKDVTRYTDRIVNHMVSHMVKRAKEVLNKYVSVTITDMTDLIPEMMYYIRWAEYMKKLQDKGFSFAKAVVSQASDQEADRYEMRARGIYNLKLAVFETEESGNIVTNDLDFDKLHRVYVLTGANRGGKTTITQAIGQLFVLAQGGIYIPGSGFTFSPTDCIYTHFPADEDKTLDLGRLGEECKRFKEIYENADSRSLLLLNESFSTTSFEEGYYIAKDCIRAILCKGMRTIYNTHMHKLAFDIARINEEQGQAEGRAFSLIVHAKDAKRSYQIEVAPPEGKSYASQIAQKYGVTYELLLHRG